MLQTLFHYFQRLRANRIYFYSLTSLKDTQPITFITTDPNTKRVNEEVSRAYGDETLHVTGTAHLPLHKFFKVIFSDTATDKIVMK